MHCDHRRDGPKQQEYGGNKREGLDRRGWGAVQHLQKMGRCNPAGSGKNLNRCRSCAVHSLRTPM